MDAQQQIVWCHLSEGYAAELPWLVDAWFAADAGGEDVDDVKRDLLSMRGIDTVLTEDEYQRAREMVAYWDALELRRLPFAELQVELEYRTRGLAELRAAAETSVMSWMLRTVSEEPMLQAVRRLEGEVTRRQGFQDERVRLAQSGIKAEFVRTLKEGVVLHEFVVQKIPSVALKRSGSVYQACCPFHADKTPSFTVYEERFICFGCGVHGDVFDLCMQILGCRGWRQAVEYVAEYLGVAIPKPAVPPPPKPLGAKPIYEAYER